MSCKTTDELVLAHFNASQPRSVMCNDESWTRLERLRLVPSRQSTTPGVLCIEPFGGTHIIQCSIHDVQVREPPSEAAGASSGIHSSPRFSRRLRDENASTSVHATDCPTPAPDIRQEGPAKASGAPPSASVDNQSRHLCIVATSGSTGQPKYVLISHESVLHRLQWQQNTFPLSGGDMVMIKTNTAFVDSLWELLSPMYFGLSHRSLKFSSIPIQCSPLQHPPLMQQ